MIHLYVNFTSMTFVATKIMEINVGDKQV